MKLVIAPLFVACLLTLCISEEARAQKGKKDTNAKYQDYMTRGNSALAMKNYPQAIHFFGLAVQVAPKDVPAKTNLTLAQKTYAAAQDFYATSFTKGRLALGNKQFQGALEAFTAAGGSLPADQKSVANAQNYFAGTTALQAGFANAIANNYIDAAKNYATAFQLVGKDKLAQAPLQELRLALAEAKNPAPHYAKDFKLGLFNLEHGKFPQAKTSFKSALDLPVGIVEKEKAQRYYEGTDCLQRGFALLTGNTPDYAAAIFNFQTAAAKLANESHAQKQLGRLRIELAEALDAEVSRGTAYLKANDLDHAFATMKKINLLLPLFPDSPRAIQFVSNFQNKAQLDLRQALDKGAIDVTTFAATGNNASSIKLAFQSAKLYTWFLKLPMGTVFQVKDDDIEFQKMVLLQDTSLEIRPGTPMQVPLAAASMIAKNDIPSGRVALVVVAFAPNKNLALLLTAFPAANLDFRLRQFATWIVLDPNLKSTEIFVGSAPPSAQEIATLRTLFTSVGLSPLNYQALK